MKALFAGILLTGAALQLRADGYLVPSGVVSNYGGFFSRYEISVLHDPANPNVGSSYTGFLFFPRGGSTFQFDHVVDVGVRVFFVSPNDPISLAPILAGSYRELQPPEQFSFSVGTPFYVGLYTGNDPDGSINGVYDDPLFGWARLVNRNGTVQILDSALAYQSGGILTGTQTLLPVPEPSSVILVLAGVCMMGAIQWRRRSRGGANSPSGV